MYVVNGNSKLNGANSVLNSIAECKKRGVDVTQRKIRS